MHEILSILLYLSVICSPCSYFEGEVNAAIEQNIVEINDVRSDEEYLEGVVNEYGEAVEGVTIIDHIEDD